jgi:hypothetical protein
MRKNLLRLYESNHALLQEVPARFKDDDMAGPFLMSPNEIYTRQQKRLLVVGQETYGWDYHVDDLEKQMAVYESFNVGEHYYSSPFWNVTRKMERAIGGDLYSCAWTNLSKYDLDGGRPYGVYEEAISQLDFILVDEIKIVEPSVCVFFTGPAFDYRLKNVFPDLTFNSVPGWSDRQLAYLTSKRMPCVAIRTYHPNYLRRSGLEEKFVSFVSQNV